jgi:hypothetical protein
LLEKYGKKSIFHLILLPINRYFCGIKFGPNYDITIHDSPSDEGIKKPRYENITVKNTSFKKSLTSAQSHRRYIRSLIIWHGKIQQEQVGDNVVSPCQIKLKASVKLK